MYKSHTQHLKIRMILKILWCSVVFVTARKIHVKIEAGKCIYRKIPDLLLCSVQDRILRLEKKMNTFFLSTIFSRNETSTPSNESLLNASHQFFLLFEFLFGMSLKNSCYKKLMCSSSCITILHETIEFICESRARKR